MQFNAQKLKQAREESGLSLEDVSYGIRDLGHTVSRQSIYNYETGKNTPDVDIAMAMAKLFKKKIEFFFN